MYEHPNIILVCRVPGPLRALRIGLQILCKADPGLQIRTNEEI
jgi:hypothetical protein